MTRGKTLVEVFTQAQKPQAETLQDIGRSAYESIAAMVARLDDPNDDGEAAREAIQEDPLSVQVRGGWHDPGKPDDGPEEYCILLSTGGPATRIVGELSEHAEPTTAHLEAQDWGTPWTRYRRDDPRDGDCPVLLRYAHEFYYSND